MNSQNHSFTSADFVMLLFETLSLVGKPEELDRLHDNPPRDLRIQTLRKAAAIWGETAPLSQIATAENWADPSKQEERAKLLKNEFPPDGGKQLDHHHDDLRTTTETLIRHRVAVSGPKRHLDGILCGGGISKIMEYLVTETVKIEPFLFEIDHLLGRLFFPAAKPIPTDHIPELANIETADIQWL